jgi:hypothetical protein
MNLNGKRVYLPQLETELTTAGVPHRGLGTHGDILHTYTPTGAAVDVPPAAQAVLDAHVPPPIPPVPDYGADLPSDYIQQIANAVQMLRQYLALASPTLAQSITAVKLLIRLVFFLLRSRNLG